MKFDDMSAKDQADHTAMQKKAAEDQLAQDDAKAAKLALCATRLADVPAEADLGQLRAIVQCLIEEIRGD